ncbi:MAG: hypothetical protein ACO1RX_22800 [Candidatus Sericytochromatia bacterium]
MSKLHALPLFLLAGALSACPASSPTVSTVSGAVPSVSPLPVPSPSPSALVSASPQPETSPSALPTASPQVSAQPAGVARLEAVPAFYGLTQKGDTAQIGIRAYDIAGREIPFSQLRLAFLSSQPSQIRVSNSGLLEALVNTGSATITITELASERALEVETRVRASGGGGGGGGASATTRHDVSADLDDAGAAFEAELAP